MYHLLKIFSGANWLSSNVPFTSNVLFTSFVKGLKLNSVVKITLHTHIATFCTNHFANIIMCCSHIFVLPALISTINKRDVGEFGLLLLTSTASFLMHLSETKHGLRGIPPFNRYSHMFLNLDRFFAIISTVFVFFKLYPYLQTHPWILLTGLCGVTLNFISENVCKNNIPGFIIAHLLWHLIAFSMLYVSVNTHILNT